MMAQLMGLAMRGARADFVGSLEDFDADWERMTALLGLPIRNNKQLGVHRYADAV
jgi:hypothetical protein